MSTANVFVVAGRWYYTADRAELVPEGDERAAILAYPAGEIISDEEADRSGVRAKMAASAEDKMARPPRNKMSAK